MTEQVGTPQEPFEKQLESCKAAIRAAAEKGDIALVMKLSADHQAISKKHEAEIEATRGKALQAIVGAVRIYIEKYIDKLVAEGKLDSADGLWVSWDFVELREVGINPAISLIKPKSKKAAATGGSHGGGGKKFDVSTEAMIAEAGAEKLFGDGENGTIKAPPKFKGKTLQGAYNEDTDGNWRFNIRKALLKATGRM